MKEVVKKAWFQALAGDANKFASGLLVSRYVQKTRDSKTGADVFKDKVQIQTKNSNGRCFLQDIECVNPKDFEGFEGKEIFFPLMENSFVGNDNSIVHYAKTFPITPILLEDLLAIFEENNIQKSVNQKHSVKTGTEFTPV